MKQNAYNLLNELKIKYDKVEHPAIFTCEEGREYRAGLDVTFAKNLFIHDKKKIQYYLVILPSYKQADLYRLRDILESPTRISFGSEEDLMEKLGATKGSVSLLNLSNVEKPDVIVVIDNEFLSKPTIGFHPNVNTETVMFSSSEIPKILEHKGAEWKRIEF